MFVTGDVAGTEAERFLEETGCRWLAKPFRLKDLLRVAARDAGVSRLGFRGSDPSRVEPSPIRSAAADRSPLRRSAAAPRDAAARGRLYGSTTAGAARPIAGLRHPHPPHRLLERQDRRTRALRPLRRRALGAERLAQALDGARVQLRDARFVDADLRADLLHRRFGVVVEADDLALARRQRRDRGANAVAHLALLVRRVGRRRLRRHERRRQRRAVDVLAGRQRRRRLDGVDADDGPAEARLVRADARGEIGERRLGAELAAQLLRARPRARGADGGRRAARRRGAARRSSRRGRGARRRSRT